MNPEIVEDVAILASYAVLMALMFVIGLVTGAAL